MKYKKSNLLILITSMIFILLLGYKIGLSRKADPKSISYYFRLFSKK